MADKASTELILEQRLTPLVGGDLVTGQWYSGFQVVKAEAEKTGRPMVAMWVNPTCGFCKRFCDAATSPRFREWMARSGAYFWLGAHPDGTASDDGRGFVFRQSEDPEIQPNQRMYYPGIAVWQCEAGNPDKVLHDYRASGRVFEKEQRGDEGVSNIIARIERSLQEPPHGTWTPPPRPARPAGAHGGCPGGHPHLKALQQIDEIIRPFFPMPEAKAAVLPLVRFVPDLDGNKRFRIVQAIADNNGHCPCKQERTWDTMCLCKEFRETGKCACGLFERYQA